MQKSTRTEQVRQEKTNEHCVICGNLTETPRKLDIHKREFYVDGVGQLCRSCYLELFLENTSFRESDVFS